MYTAYLELKDWLEMTVMLGKLGYCRPGLSSNCLIIELPKVGWVYDLDDMSLTNVYPVNAKSQKETNRT